jgi:hypothetical protein
MKRAALIREMRRGAERRGRRFELLRHGAEHDLYRCGGVTIALPRHREIRDRLADALRAMLEPELGDRWWDR